MEVEADQINRGICTICGGKCGSGGPEIDDDDHSGVDQEAAADLITELGYSAL